MPQPIYEHESDAASLTDPRQSPKKRRRLFADVTPLRESPEFRRLWASQACSAIGTQMTAVALAVQLYQLTHSSFAVGALGLALAVPLLVVGLFGGTVADSMDRRKIVLVTSSGLVVVAVVLAAQAVLDLRQVWLLYVLAALQSTLFAIELPASSSFLARLLPPERIAAATALGQVSFQASLTAGPLLAGLVIATAGLEAAYAVDAVTFFAVLYAVLRLRAMRPEGAGVSPGLRAITEGLRFVRHNPLLAAVFLVDLNAMVLGMPRALFPALADTHFDGGAAVTGVLYAAPAVGGLLGAIFSGPLGHVHRQGRAMLFSVTVWGAATACFALTADLVLAVAILVVAGAADVVTAVFRATILQVNTPDELRGRLNGLDFVVGEGGPRLGDVRAGSLAAITSPVVSALGGGLACVAGAALIALFLPAVARYDDRKRPPLVAGGGTGAPQPQQAASG
ncbi:MFS transporter [Dactylosporangium fulvum]|uniref:MFS transporter n=1 Tax=Dactylosporangium fulvum TaxID=53359 RepID=UPI0031DB99D6